MRCNSADIGCAWIGTLGSLQQHSISCKFALIPCPKQCKDEQNKIRKYAESDLKEHLERECPHRDYECVHCGEKRIVFSDKDVHFKKCKKILLPCDNAGCGKAIQRQGMKRHLETCQYQETSCKYMKLGCEVRMIGKDIATHESEDDKFHLHKAMDTITALQEKVTTLGNGQSLTFKVTEYKKKLKNNEKASSPSFYSSSGHYMTVHIYVNGRESGESSYVSASVSVLSKSGEPLKNFGGTVTLTLLNQLINEQHHAKAGKDFPTFIRHTMLDYNEDRNTQFLKDDTLYFRVTVDLPNQKPWLECRRSSQS